MTILLLYILRISAFKTQIRPKLNFHLHLCNQRAKASLGLPSSVISPTSVFSAPRTKVSNLRAPEPAQPMATHALLIINLMVFLWTSRNSRIKMKLLKSNFHIARGDWYRIISALFLHGNVGHLMINSLSLLNLGRQVRTLDIEGHLISPYDDFIGRWKRYLEHGNFSLCTSFRDLSRTVQPFY